MAATSALEEPKSESNGKWKNRGAGKSGKSRTKTEGKSVIEKARNDEYIVINDEA